MNEESEKPAEPTLVLAYNRILEYIRSIGYNTDEDMENTYETAERASKAMSSIILPIDTIYNEVLEHTSKAFPLGTENALKEGDRAPYVGEVISGIYATGLCPHHLMPVSYNVTLQFDVGGGDKVMGLSKYARVVKVLSSRPILQERLGRDIADLFSTGWSPDASREKIVLSTTGCIVALKGRHTCASCRGIREENFAMLTFVASGSLNDDGAIKRFSSLMAMF